MAVLPSEGSPFERWKHEKPVLGARSRWLQHLRRGERVHCSVLHRAIVGATNRPTRGKDARRLLAATISPIICAFKQLHGNPVVLRPLSHDRPNSPTGGSGDIIISGPSPEHRIDASGNVFIGLVSPRAERPQFPYAAREFKNFKSSTFFNLFVSILYIRQSSQRGNECFSLNFSNTSSRKCTSVESKAAVMISP